MKETRHILISTDDRYAPYCGITLTSVFKQQGLHVPCLILTGHELKRHNVEKFRELESSYGCEIEFIIAF
ncbi:MAG: hypothetical protein IKN31_01420 [Bacteroidales bacterium]|nr:hypothetical protein [Bacteroidales bacterium]